MTTVRKEITIDAPLERVWRYFEDPDLLAAWLMRNDFRPEPGSEFEFNQRPAGEWDGVVRCRLLEFEPPSRIAFTWDANTIGADTVVTIDLSEAGGKTRLTLVHANFEQAAGDIAAHVRSHSDGWDDHLQVLRTQAEEEQRGSQAVAGPVDWTCFDLHLAVDAVPERVLQAWSTAAGMEGFFVEMMRITAPGGAERAPDEPARPGDRFTWRWHNGRRLRGGYLPPESDNEVRFTFGDSVVAVDARLYRGGSLVRLRQSGIPDDAHSRMHVHVNCRAAWVYFLTVLKTLLEHGIDGRDTSRATGSSFSTYFDRASLELE